MRTVLTSLVIGAAAAVLVAACSPGADYPTVLDRPTPRGDTTMTSDQIKAATDALISDRDHLNAETQPNGQPGVPPNAAVQASAASAPKSAGSAAKP